MAEIAEGDVFWLPYRSGRSVDGLREFSEVEIRDYPEVNECE